ncbi:hypothetical protein FRC04_002877, partial [Tulasnella sp. 424]
GPTSGPTMEVGDDDGDADAIGEDDDFSEMVGEGDSRDSSPQPSEDRSMTSSLSDASSSSRTPSPYDSPADGPSGGNGAVNPSIQHRILAIMKIPTFAPLATYDFLVVGAGAGGGPSTTMLTITPKTKYGDVQTWYPRSQGLGGCTIHNALINLIPHKWDFEQLQNMFNDETWDWQNVAKPWLRRMVSTQLPLTSLLTDYPDQQLVDLVATIHTGCEPVVNEDYNDWRNDKAQGGSWITLTKQANGTRSAVVLILLNHPPEAPQSFAHPKPSVVRQIEPHHHRLTSGTTTAVAVPWLTVKTSVTLHWYLGRDFRSVGPSAVLDPLQRSSVRSPQNPARRPIGHFDVVFRYIT